MENIFIAFILMLVIVTIASEMYKMYFAHNKESQDERGKIINYKIKSFSYTLLTGGIIVGVVLVAVFDVLPREFFIFYVMTVFFIQSIASSIYLAVVRKSQLL